MLESMRWRLIGPHRGGRVVAVAGDPQHRLVFYFGACSGGVWKTTDGGNSWENVSDGFFKTAPVGAIAVAQSDPNVIYVGMGEACLRGNVSHGDGVYRSTDGGRTWKHLGLAATRHIGRVRVHPQDPDVVYVAALGHAFGPNPERGVFRSTDGGRHWQRILFRSEDAGAIDLAMDPTNPRILYAAFYEVRRGPHFFTSGGPGSSLYKSTDGGDTWVELTDNPGLPKGVKGRIGVAVSPARPDRVWASVEAAEGGLFRSDDGGATWQRVNDEQDLRQRAWYYSHVFADPKDPETVWCLNVRCLKSTDGGRTFTAVPTPHGDNHDLWIDPNDPDRMIEGNDGGACVSFDGGASWSTLYNQPTAQFYHVTTDNQFPYRVYGAQQDNTTLSGPSFSPKGAITMNEWYDVGGGESGYIAVRPDDPSVVYAGSYSLLTRYDHRTRQVQNITPWPENPMGWGAKDLKYRLQWTFPIHVSPHDPNVLYAGAQVVFRSRDEGMSWEVISPDLTRNDPSRMGPSGGPITKDNTSVEYYCTIFALAESPVQAGVIWAGSDDGLIHVTRDDGRTWQNVTPPQLPEWSLISIIEPSPHDAAVAYVAATRYKLDDFRPYLLKTKDFGATWETITTGIPEDDFTRVIRADPKRRGLLYAGTETGVYVSFDDGAHWESLQLNLPVVPIHDLAVKNDDLIAATHGRSFWILDDLTPLHQLTDEVRNAPAFLFQPRPTYRMKLARGFGGDPGARRAYLSTGGFVASYKLEKTPDGEERRVFLDAGENPPAGVLVHYYLREKPADEVRLAFLDAEGNLIKEFSSKAPEKPAGGGHGNGPREPRLRAEAGMNRFVWDMRYPDARNVPGAIFWAGGVSGPQAAPGTYQVRLTVGGQTYTQTFEIRKDPRVAASEADLREQFAFLIEIRDKLSATHDAVNELRSIRQQIDDWLKRAEGRPEAEALAEASRPIKDKLLAIEEELIQFRSKAHEDPLNFPIKLNNKLASLAGVVASADAAPTRQAREVYAELATRIDQQLAALRAVVSEDLPAFNRLVRSLDLPAIVVRS
jgi:photosystem II stability/assembly factor-like uncharacterized protein